MITTLIVILLVVGIALLTKRCVGTPQCLKKKKKKKSTDNEDIEMATPLQQPRQLQQQQMATNFSMVDDFYSTPYDSLRHQRFRQPNYAPFAVLPMGLNTTVAHQVASTAPAIVHQPQTAIVHQQQSPPQYEPVAAAPISEEPHGTEEPQEDWRERELAPTMTARLAVRRPQ